MLEKLREHILKKQLFAENDKLLLAVSGGIDSMVMLHLFQQLGYQFEVAHMNFALRGEESDKDERFLINYCNQYKIKLHSKKVDTGSYATSAKLSIQMAARELRYTWFKSLKTECGFNHLLTAHHADDSVETIFINIIRGTGLSGLKGIVNNEQAIRPLLIFNRRDIEQYAKEHELDWREDSSNASDKYLRNKLRHDLLPKIDELNTNWRAGLIQLAEDISVSEKILNTFYQKHKEVFFVNNRLWLNRLEENEYRPYLIRKLLLEFNFSHATIDDILDNLHLQKGKEYESWSHRLIKGDAFFEIVKREEILENDAYVINLNDETLIIPNSVYDLQILESKDNKGNYVTGDTYLDYNKLTFPLLLRKWQAGDWFVPLGMKGKKKLSDYFVDEKFTIQEKENTFVLVSSDDIVCILGHRTDERYKVSGDTNIIYHINRKHG